MDNFDLKKFLTENKLTSISRIDEAKFPSFKTTEDGKVVDALTNAVYYDEGETPQFEKLMDRALNEPQVATAFGEYMKKKNIARKDLGDINVIKRTYSQFDQEVGKGSDEDLKNRVNAIRYFAGDDDRDWNSTVKDLADRALPAPPAAPDISHLQKPKGPSVPPPPPPVPGQ